MTTTDSGGDPYDLQRFIAAQEHVYAAVLAELTNGRKRSHWMWYVFPQIVGLGSSATAVLYAVKSREEAQQYLEHPVLGSRLRECTSIVLAINGRSASEVFGYPDDLKLKSSMTLFAAVAEPGSAFAKVIDKFFGGERDIRAIELMEASRPK